ncbi:esterase E4-like [Spodoptera frugiperda]|uniref:Carboxylic ester hydrolase n=1 Tax=Spodoptera frugiperda TaxID=7108 RepID=A0A9R0CZV1_SPOFR|nr:esterase E4-like [Spodoptera frugiperda]
MSGRAVLVYMLCWWWLQLVGGLFLTPVVEVSQGRLRGLRSYSGQYRYYGIPYATSERFQPPRSPPKWSGIFHAVSRFDSCAQTLAVFRIGREECQFLDVYTPGRAAQGRALPVLVFLHGGAYYMGSKWHYDPEYLVNKDVIVVTVNYRLGVLGFLCLNNVANLGLKDQLAALKWIRRNISAFGGDPDNVTISGHSAGSTSAAMHLLSRRSKGLFHKAILMSGVALAPWSFNPEPLTPAFEDAAKMGNVRNERDVYDTFLKSSLNDVLYATQGTSIDPRYFKYAPCVDTNFTDAFFHDTPYNIITSGDFNKVPVIIGVTDTEGVLFYGFHNQRTLEYLDNNFIDRLPSVFSWCSDEDKRKIAKEIRSHYFGKQRINSRDAIKGTVDYYSDWITNAAVHAFSKLIAKYSDEPVYNYMFSYRGGRNFGSVVYGRGLGLGGATHSDDIFYIFKPAGFPLRIRQADMIIIDRQTTMLTNFMKFGDPTPHTSALLPVRWPPSTANRSVVLHMGRQLHVAAAAEGSRGLFLLRVLCQYGLRGYVPCDSAMQCTPCHTVTNKRQ